MGKLSQEEPEPEEKLDFGGRAELFLQQLGWTLEGGGCEDKEHI